MKNLILSTAVAILTITGIQAQENKDVQSTTTVKKVTEKGTDVKTKVVSKTETAKEIVKVKGNNEQDQPAHVIKKKDIDKKVVADDVSIDVANRQNQLAIKQKQEAELARTIAEQKAKAAAEAEKERQEKIRKQQAELEARRAALMKRPEGMAKLKKD